MVCKDPRIFGYWASSEAFTGSYLGIVQDDVFGCWAAYSIYLERLHLHLCFAQLQNLAYRHELSRVFQSRVRVDQCAIEYRAKALPTGFGESFQKLRQHSLLLLLRPIRKHRAFRVRAFLLAELFEPLGALLTNLFAERTRFLPNFFDYGARHFPEFLLVFH